jgi:hypothetical protein
MYKRPPQNSMVSFSKYIDIQVKSSIGTGHTREEPGAGAFGKYLKTQSKISSLI